MVTQITDDISCIRFSFDGNIYLLNKAWIRSIETVQTDTVKIDIAAGPLKHLYLKLGDVTLPAGLADVFALRDAIEAMLDTSAANQQDPALIKMLISLQKLMIANTVDLNRPSITDESIPSVVYYGYASKGGVTSQPTWAINQISTSKNIITSAWANGDATYGNVWDDRYKLKYQVIDNSTEGQPQV